MGLFRKLTSVSTLGLVDYRSDKERTAKYTRQTRNATRAAVVQNARQIGYQRDDLAQGHVQHVEAQAQRIQPVPALVAAPGWYVDQAGVMRWFDGYRWTEATQAPPRIAPLQS